MFKGFGVTEETIPHIKDRKVGMGGYLALSPAMQADSCAEKFYESAPNV